DNTNEQDQGGTYSFRSRSSKLGDIVHSAPILVGNVIYAGSNDGMVHAFNATTGDEIFAYVPRLVFENLNKLTIENPNYDHTYFVDKEAYFSHLGDLLVGTLGKGGKGIYCLDVTNTASAEFNAANIVKWEFPNSTDPDNSPDADLGYGFSRAFVVDSNAGPVVILGNGYQSTNHRAFLYILDAATGLLLNKIDTGAGDAVDCNGLSTPTLVDDDLDGRVDFAYAGDLLGNMWKFDLRDINAANWRVAYDDGSPQPLFQAINAQGFRQPITTAPDVMDTCENNTAGLMVVFGTGRYIGNTDFSDVSVQTFYGIWDWQQEWVNAGQSSVDKNLGSFTAARTLSSPGAQGATLAQQTMIYHGSPFGEQYRVLSSNPIDWYSPINSTGSHVGWYFDLPATGERSVQDFVIYSNVVIAISSIPSASPCAAGGDSIIYAIDACTGGSPPGPFWDANGDGVIDSNDLINIGSAADPIMAPITGFGTPGMVYPPAIVSLNDDTALFYFGKSTGGIADGPGGGGPPAPPKGKKELTGITGWKEIETD
ncbi:MAG: PQQ-binding-like beta-propeller repeat protein, partial [Desulfobacterales bacterium]|nr:PQQ-binding-like beta-propeller repeat protein [Desulfobacterales bacterium]